MTLQPLTRGGLLGAFGLLAALLLSSARTLTAPAIADRKTEDEQASLAAILPPRFRATPPSRRAVRLGSGVEVPVFLATAPGGPRAVAFPVTGQGYGGPIELLMAVDEAGTVLGVRVTAHTETPGLGDKVEARKSDWIRSFDGKRLGAPPRARWTVTKDGGDFDAFTGATITPRAVVHAVRDGLETYERERMVLLGDAP